MDICDLLGSVINDIIITGVSVQRSSAMASGENHDMLRFCNDLPKVELHAHLNGSLSVTTLRHLSDLHQKLWPHEQMPKEWETCMNNGERGTLDNPFKMFPLIQSVTDNPEAIRIATENVIRDFAKENVKYLELRSTPRAVVGRMSKEEYIEAIMDGIKNVSDVSCITKLLVSLDRRLSLPEIEANIDLVARLKTKYPSLIVGLDLSGDPRVGDATPLIPLLDRARKDHNLKLSPHLAEVPFVAETKSYLEFGPDRIGHGTCIHPEMGGSDELLNMLLTSKIPIEVCLTSNFATQSIESVHDNHLIRFYRLQHPIAICTDDKGVFSCTLSDEYLKAAIGLSLDRQEIFEISFKSIDFIFGPESEKELLRKMWQEWKLQYNL